MVVGLRGVLSREELREVKRLLPRKLYLGVASRSVFLKRVFGDDLSLVKELWDLAGSNVRFFQMDALLDLYAQRKLLLEEVGRTGVVSPLLHHVDKNIIVLSDKMRKQDEGIRISGDFKVSHDRFRELIDGVEFRIRSGVNAQSVEQRKEIVRNASIFKGE